MQDRTINNALQALRKQGGHQGKLAEVLLDMRGVSWSGITQDRPMRRGQTKRVVMNELKQGPQRASQLAQVIVAMVPGITNRAATNRVYQALLRLEDKGKVVRDVGPQGCLWRLAVI